MNYELIILEKRTGNAWDAASLTQSVTYTTNRTGSPGTLKFTINAGFGVSFLEGDPVRFSVDGQLIFLGWVFTKNRDRHAIIEVTCYDQLRYLKASAMEKFVETGQIRSLGLSNWYVKELEEFLPQITITPALVQNEIHPYYQENDVIPYIQDLGIVVQGWYPLGGRGHTAELLSDEIISAIAESHGVSPAQVILRWNLQKGVVVIPGSSNPDHIRENTELYGFALTDAEMAQINALDRNEKHDWY